MPHFHAADAAFSLIFSPPVIFATAYAIIFALATPCAFHYFRALILHVIPITLFFFSLVTPCYYGLFFRWLRFRSMLLSLLPLRVTLQHITLPLRHARAMLDAFDGADARCHADALFYAFFFTRQRYADMLLRVVISSEAICDWEYQPTSIIQYHARSHAMLICYAYAGA